MGYSDDSGLYCAACVIAIIICSILLGLYFAGGLSGAGGFSIPGFDLLILVLIVMVAIGIILTIMHSQFKNIKRAND